MRNFFFWLCFLSVSLVALCCSIGNAQAQERILSFDAVVDILASGQLAVEETITVVSEGQQIRHGIYRDFPLSYSDINGATFRVDFDVVHIELDGHDEPYHTQKIVNGVRVYMGTKERFLSHGTHTYVLHYVTNRQIGYFPDHDELFWNVTGNGWKFTIEQARVTFMLPQTSQFEDFEFYTGRAGSRAADAQLIERSDETIVFATSSALPPGHGFSVVVSWPKGIITAPGAIKRFSWMFRDYFFDILAGSGLFLLALYYFLSWLKVGRDPQPGAVIPRFTPPQNVSPAAARFIAKMAYDNKAFAALLVNMAVKGVLEIKQLGTKYTLILRSRDTENLSPGERAIQEALFQLSDRITLNKQNNAIIREAVTSLQNVLKRDLLNIYFRLNRIYLIPGLVLSAGIVACVILGSIDVNEAATITLWIIMWSVGVGVLFVQTVTRWREAWRKGSSLSLKFKALFSSMFLLSFMGGWFLGADVLLGAVSRTGLLVILALLIVNGVFAFLLKAVTLPGRKILDQLEGLKMYILTAEKDRLNLLNPPEKTPELFEKLLPWALALDVEQQWCDQFATLFVNLGQEQQEYAPMWYSSRQGFTANSFSSSLGASLSSSISSHAVAPGSSSGFSSGGGGGAGGGGGGGGGGGW